MIKDLLKNNKFYLFINICIIFILFMLLMNWQKYSYTFNHDSFWSYIFPYNSRIGSLFSFLYCFYIPQYFNININDFKSGIGAFFISIIYLGICLIFSNAFFINFKDKINIFFRKELIIILPLCFLLLSYPFEYIIGAVDDKCIDNLFMQIDEICVFSEYNLGYIFLFLFYIFLYKTLVCDKIRKFNLFAGLSIIVCSFLLGMWTELFNISVMACIGLLILYFLIFDRKRFNNKLLIMSFISFILGFILFYYVGDFFSGSSFGTYTYNIFDRVIDNLKLFSSFFEKFMFYTFYSKWIMWLLILVSMIFLKFQKIQKINKYIFILSIFILLGYVFCNFIQIFVNNLIVGLSYPFERDSYNNIQLNLLEFVFLVLLGIIYSFNKNTSKIIICTFLIIILFLSYYFQGDYLTFLNEKYNMKLLLYKIERNTLIYNSLGESVILPEKYLDECEIRNNRLFVMQDQFLYNRLENFKDFMKDKYFDNTYSLYASYYNYNYKNNFIGFRYTNDEYAEQELYERLQLLNITLPIEQEKNITFKQLKKFDKILTLKDLEKLNFTDKNKYLLNKIKGYIYFKDNDYDNALKYYELYLKSIPNDFDSLINCAKIYTQKEEYKKVKEIYKKLINLDSNNLMFKYNYLDILYSKENKYKEALNASEDILKLNINGLLIPYSYLYKALILKELKNYSEAEKYFNLFKAKDFRSFAEFSNENQINNFQDFKNSEKLFLPIPYFCIPEEHD